MFSASNRLEKTIFAGDSVGFAYDPTRSLTGLTPPGRPEHTFSYSPVDLRASYVAPGADTTLLRVAGVVPHSETGSLLFWDSREGRTTRDWRGSKERQ